MASTLTTQCLLLVLAISELHFPEFAMALGRSETFNSIKEVNDEGPFVGIISADQTEEEAFLNAGAFEADPKQPFMVLSGRLFRVGKIYGNNVLFVRCGEGLVNAAAVTQQMLDLFDIIGIVHFGIAGNANDSMSLGDVTIPKQFIQTGLWEWLNLNGTLGADDFAHLDVGNYNVPKGNSVNLLGRIGFESEEFYSKSGKPNTAQSLVWANVTAQWFELAATLESVELERCVNSTFCLPYNPKVVIGLNGSTANIFVDNAAYRKFLFETFQVSSVDMESFAIVMTSLSNDIPVIVIRALSDLAGETRESLVSTFGSLAASNAVKVALAFLKILWTTINSASAA